MVNWTFNPDNLSTCIRQKTFLLLFTAKKPTLASISVSTIFCSSSIVLYCRDCKSCFSLSVTSLRKKQQKTQYRKLWLLLTLDIFHFV